MSDWSSALRHALRSLAHQPTFTLIALATLALGIGANTAIFSVIKTVVLNPLPYPAPERIVVLWEVSPEGNQDRVSIPTFEDWRTDLRVRWRSGRVSPRGLLVLGPRRPAQRASSPRHAGAVRGSPGPGRAWADLHARRCGRRRRAGRRGEPWVLVAGTRRGRRGDRAPHPSRCTTFDGDRRDAAGFRVSDQPPTSRYGRRSSSIPRTCTAARVELDR